MHILRIETEDFNYNLFAVQFYVHEIIYFLHRVLESSDDLHNSIFKKIKCTQISSNFLNKKKTKVTVTILILWFSFSFLYFTVMVRAGTISAVKCNRWCCSRAPQECILVQLRRRARRFFAGRLVLSFRERPKQCYIPASSLNFLR